MTEADWLNCTNPEYMMPSLRGKASERKLRLLTVALCDRVKHLMLHEGSRLAMNVAERMVQGNATEHERAATETLARGAAREAFVNWEADLGEYSPPAGVCYWVAAAAIGAVIRDAQEGAEEAVSTAGLGLAWSEDESLVAGPDHWAGIELSGPWSGIIRDIFGNPFRPVAFDPRWLTANVRDLARAIYDDSAFERLPILADALMDAGCDNEDILAHCRSAGPHIRGCWVVDLVLDKK